jgi:hypothetical protein
VVDPVASDAPGSAPDGGLLDDHLAGRLLDDLAFVLLLMDRDFVLLVLVAAGEEREDERGPDYPDATAVER